MRDLRLAVARLREIVADQTSNPDDEATGLAMELVRWMRYACEVNPDELVECLGHQKPLSPNEPGRDELDALLVRHGSLAELAVELSRRYTDPVRTLRQFLDEVAPPGTDVAVVVLGAARRRDEPFEQYRIYDNDLLELLLNADLRPMSPDDRRHYVWSLGAYRDPRIVPRIRAVIDWALDDLATNQTDSAKDLVCSAMTQLAERELEPTTAQRERAENSGVRWHHPMDRGATLARIDN